MGILRIIIGVFAIVIFTKIGANKSQLYKENYAFYNGLCVFCSNYLSELKFSKKELKTLIKKDYFSKELSLTLNDFFNEKNANSIYLPPFLSEVEKDKIISFLSMLGKGDSVSQQGVINGFLVDFTVLKNDKYKEFLKYKSFYKKLGFYVGLIMLILVI